MNELKDLNDLLIHEIQILHSGETLVLASLKRMILKADNAELKSMLQQHLEETEIHIKRLEQCAEMLGIRVNGEGNPGIKGIILEGEKVMHKKASPQTMDATLIAGAQKIEHYEISGYGSAACYAEELGHTEVAGILRQTLSEEQAMDTRLNDLAKNKINLQAENADGKGQR